MLEISGPFDKGSELAALELSFKSVLFLELVWNLRSAGTAFVSISETSSTKSVWTGDGLIR